MRFRESEIQKCNKVSRYRGSEMVCKVLNNTRHNPQLSAVVQQ